MRIGQFSKRAQVPIQTLRFYERKKLLREPPRTPSGYRSYSESDLARVRFIRDAQDLGFTLKEIHLLLTIHEPDSPPGKPAQRWPEAFRIADERLTLIDKKIAQLRAFRQRLAAGLDQARQKNLQVCPASLPLKQTKR